MANLEQRLDSFDEPRVFRDHLGTETADRDAIFADEELLEVPTHVACLSRIVWNRREDRVQRVLVAALDVELAEQRERHAVVHAAELLDLLGRAGFLAEEL